MPSVCAGGSGGASAARGASVAGHAATRASAAASGTAARAAGRSRHPRTSTSVAASSAYRCASTGTCTAHIVNGRGPAGTFTRCIGRRHLKDLPAGGGQSDTDGDNDVGDAFET
jgi:hypothetical protein